MFRSDTDTEVIPKLCNYVYNNTPEHLPFNEVRAPALPVHVNASQLVCAPPGAAALRRPTGCHYGCSTAASNSYHRCPKRSTASHRGWRSPTLNSNSMLRKVLPVQRSAVAWLARRVSKHFAQRNGMAC